MRTRTTLAAASALAAVALLGWLAASGRLASDVQAQDKKSTDETPYNFERGYPTKDTTQRTRDDADFQRAVVAYRFWYPTVSIEGFFDGNRRAGSRTIRPCRWPSARHTGSSSPATPTRRMPSGSWT